MLGLGIFRSPGNSTDIHPGWDRAAKSTMNWIGGIFLAALITLAVAVYTDARMTRCEPKSFAAVVGLCTVNAR
jgi:hypothetical protein